MTQSPIPLIEANLTFSLKPGEVEFIRKQKAGGTETGKDAGVGGWAGGAGKGMWSENQRPKPGRTPQPVASGQSKCQALNSSESCFGFPQTGHEVAQVFLLSLLQEILIY